MSNPNCIDICSYNGSVDFVKVMKAGVRTVIIRSIRKGGVIDGKFEEFYRGAIAQGMSVGAYLYTYATSKSAAKKEADQLLKLLNGRPLAAGVWLDMETSDLRRASADVVQGIADAFRGKLRAAGYETGVYCDADFYREKNHFKGYDSACPFWIAAYGKNDGKQHTKPAIGHKLWAWQYSDKGTVDGVPGKCDVSEVFGLGMVNPLVCDLPTLRRGDRSLSVKLMQMRLCTETGIDLDDDGIFGAITEDVVKVVQRDHKLKEDGVCGPDTWEVIL